MKTDSEIPQKDNLRKRLTASLRVYYGPSQSILLHSFSVNLSGGGLFFKTEIPFSVDEKLLLSFTLPGDSDPICSKARVAWVNLQDNPRRPALPNGIGIEFVGLSEDSLKSIQTLLKYVEVGPVS